jgi:hypothetical protein
VSVEYVPPGPDDELDELDELLDLAAELSAPDEQPQAWARRARFAGQGMSRLMRSRRGEEAAGGGEGEIPHLAATTGDDAAGGQRQSDERMRTELDAVVSELGELTREHAGRLPAISRPRFDLTPWRKPAAVSGALLLTGLVGGILVHTLGPDYSPTPFTSAPLVALGPSATPGGNPGRFPTLAALPRTPEATAPALALGVLPRGSGSGAPGGG